MKLWKFATVAIVFAFATPALAAGRLPSPATYTSQGAWSTTATQAVPVERISPNRMVFPVSVPMHIVVGLSMRNRAAANALVQRQYRLGDMYFHHWLTPEQFTALFNPTYGQAAAVASYLQRQGFINISIAPNHLLVSASASPSRVEAAFHTAIRGSFSHGQLVYGNVSAAVVPAQFRGLIVAVLGLTNAYHMHTTIVHTRRPRTFSLVRSTGPKAVGTPPPCVTTAGGVCRFGEYGPTQYQVAYDAAKTACPAACTGYGTSVAVMAEGNVSQVVKDLRTAEAFWGLPQVPYSTRQVGVSSIDTSGLDEWDLDTQSSSGIAQTVKHLYVYYTTSLSDSDIALEYSAWVNDKLTQAGNSSFGEPESLAYADGAMLVDDEELNQAAAQGMTMFASTGDNGQGCPVIAATGVPFTGVPENCYPSTSPYVVAVGGTTLDTNANGTQPGTYYGEHAWIATGGGYSKYEYSPYWQSNGICPECTVLETGGVGRGIADVAMCADNNGCPMDVFVNGAQTGVGGTSLSSPLSMGIWARLETHFSNKLGFAAPVYYGVYGKYEPCPLGSKACLPSGEPGSDTSALPPDTTAPVGGFHDVLMGSNGLGVPAGPGWDTPTGLGSIDYCKMQKDIAYSIFSGH